jgi:2-phospho-L-lactate guanylyltransferase (CobY/MobA/RfbA family)
VTNAVSKVENASGVASAVTLPVATNGVVKKIVATVTNSNIVVTPSLGSGFSTITFTAVGQTVTLQYITDRWFILSAYGVTIA